MKRLLTAILLVASFGWGCEDTPNGAYCFVAGTQILTPSGPVRIEELRIGDEVVSVDPGAGRESTSRVKALRSAAAAEYLSVRANDGYHVSVTGHHPFWDPHKRSFREIRRFAPGDSLFAWGDAEGKIARVAMVEIIRKPAMVYHLEVDRAPHTFVAGGLVVHNKPPTIPRVDVTLKVLPADAGWIHFENRFVGQGRDTSFTLSQTAYFLEAVPREGWAFDHWVGNVSAIDTFFVMLYQQDGDRVECHFSRRQ